MGINVIRLPLVPQTLDPNNAQGRDPFLKNHSSVRIANSRLALETMIRAADAANIEVMLDIHSCSNYVGWRKGRLDARPPWVDATRDNYEFTRENYSCASTGNPPTVTTTHPYDTTTWLANLRTLAGMSTALGVDNIIVKSVKPSATDEGASNKQERQWQAEYGLLRRDLEHVRQTFKEVRYAIGIRNMRMNLYARNGRQLDLAVIATEPDYLLVTRSGIQRGRFITEADDERAVERLLLVRLEIAQRVLRIFGVGQDPVGQVGGAAPRAAPDPPGRAHA